MHKGILISLYDAKADSYSPPTVAASRADAIRKFEMLVNAKDGSLVASHPEDFTIFEVATFEEGCRVSTAVHCALANGVDVRRTPDA